MIDLYYVAIIVTGQDISNEIVRVAVEISTANVSYVKGQDTSPGTALKNSGKRQRDRFEGTKPSLSTIDPNTVTIAAVRSKAAIVNGQICGTEVEMMLDSGSSVSLVQQGVISQPMDVTHIRPTPGLQLVTASGEQLKIVDYIKAPVTLGKLSTKYHDFVVVNNLVAPVILGMDFLQINRIVLDFASRPIGVLTNKDFDTCTSDTLKPIFDAERKTKAKVCAVTTVDGQTPDIIEDCTIPNFTNSTKFEFPTCTRPTLAAVINRHKSLFRNTPGTTSEAYHHIPTAGPPLRIPP